MYGEFIDDWLADEYDRMAAEAHQQELDIERDLLERGACGVFEGYGEVSLDEAQDLLADDPEFHAWLDVLEDEEAERRNAPSIEAWDRRA